MKPKRYFYVTEIVDCDACHGSGTHYDGDAFVPCEKCSGTGSASEPALLEDALTAFGVMDVIERKIAGQAPAL